MTKKMATFSNPDPAEKPSDIKEKIDEAAARYNVNRNIYDVYEAMADKPPEPATDEASEIADPVHKHKDSRERER